MASTVLDRLVAGEDVTVDQLLREDAERRLAGLRAQAAAQAEAERAEAERQRRVRLEKARVRMAKAVADFVAAGARREEARTAAWHALAGLGPLPPGVALGVDGFGTITVGTTVYRRSRIQTAIWQATVDAYAVHFPKTPVELDKRPD